MLTYVLGVLLLVGLFLAGPVYRKIAHARLLKELGLDGAVIVSRPWGLDGLSIRRADWDGEVEFKAPGEKWGGRQGHLLFKAPLRGSSPTMLFEGEAVAVPEESRAFAERLMTPELRGLLALLRTQGGRFVGVREGTVEITGPLPVRASDLREFLRVCEAVVGKTLAAVSG